MFKDKYRSTLVAGLVAAAVLQIVLVAGVFLFAPGNNFLPVKASAAQPAAYASARGY